MRARRPRLLRPRRRYVAAVVALCAWTLLACGCEGLRNPAVIVTPPTAWNAGSYGAVTTTRSVPAERSSELLRTVPAMALDYADAVAPRDGFVALVTVRPQWGAARPPDRVELITELRLETGERVQRRWVVPGQATVWHAGFALPSRPVAAVTAIRI